MKTSFHQLLLLFFVALISSCKMDKRTTIQTIGIVNATCEYMEKPMGIETQSPRFSWQLISEENGEKQIAYRIIVADSKESIEKGVGNLWDTEQVDSDQSINLSYQGTELGEMKRYWWAVKVWNASGQEQDWSDPEWFETGIFSEVGWKNAKWIGVSEDRRPAEYKSRSLQTSTMDTPILETSHPSPLFRKEYTFEKKVANARIYLAGLGYNELYINGNRVGDAVLNPGQTSYDERAFYDVYDITHFLGKGPNVFGVMLGNGFYGQSMAFGVKFLDYGEPALKCLICLEYADGTTESIESDESWLSSTGPVVFDNVYAGETYDARQEIADWSKVDCKFNGWSPSRVLTNVEVPLLTAQLLQPIRKILTLPVKDFHKTERGTYIFDCGQNIAGWAKILVNEAAGTRITIRYSEILTEDKQQLETITTGGGATGFDQIDEYICKGGGEEVWEPRFTYHGFRYMEVDGISNPTMNSVEACLVHSDVERVGRFECSDETLNRIYSTSLWTIVDNLHSVPEDCPHREKCAWLGDAHASVEVMINNFDMRRFWIKFMNDVETNLGTGEETYEKIPATAGIPTNIAVGRRVCQEARPDWGSALILIPWANYLYYGNKQMFEENYTHMVRWMSYLHNYLKDNILYQGYGDWCPPDGNRGSNKTSVPLTSTAYYYHTLDLMARISRLLGEWSLEKAYAQEALAVKEAFNKKFFDDQQHTYGTQTANAVALDLGLVPEGLEKEVARSLAQLELTEKKEGHLYTGIHGSKRVYGQLSKFGYENELFDMLEKESFPSYKYLFQHEFTTWPETFHDYDRNKDSYKSGSHNHPMQAGFAMWFHQNVGGIQPDEAYPGFKHFTIRPFGYNRLEYAKASYQSVYGTIVSNWKSEQGNFMLELEIPVNTSATVYVPAKSEKDFDSISGIQKRGFENGILELEVSSGSYSFKTRI